MLSIFVVLLILIQEKSDKRFVANRKDVKTYMQIEFHSSRNKRTVSDTDFTEKSNSISCRMGDDLSNVAVDLLRISTTEETQPMSTVAISHKSNVYDVAEIIENW